VAARYDHRPTISGTDIGQRQEHIHLSTAEMVVDEAVLATDNAVLAPRMEREVPTLPPD
jgi:hypothetical protein